MCDRTLTHHPTSRLSKHNHQEPPKRVRLASKTELQMHLELLKTASRHVTQPYLHHLSEILQKQTKVSVRAKTKMVGRKMTAKIQIQYQHQNRPSLSNASAAAGTRPNVYWKAKLSSFRVLCQKKE